MKKILSLVTVLIASGVTAEPLNSDYGLNFEVKIPFGKTKNDPDVVLSLSRKTEWMPHTHTLKSGHLANASSRQFWSYHFGGVAESGYGISALSDTEGNNKGSSAKTVWIVIGAVAAGALLYNATKEDEHEIKCGPWQQTPGGGASRDCY